MTKPRYACGECGSRLVHQHMPGCSVGARSAEVLASLQPGGDTRFKAERDAAVGTMKATLRYLKERNDIFDVNGQHVIACAAAAMTGCLRDLGEDVP